MPESNILKISLPRKKIDAFRAYALAENMSCEELVVKCIERYVEVVGNTETDVVETKKRLLQIANILEIPTKEAFYSMTEKTKEVNDQFMRLPISPRQETRVRELAKETGFTLTAFINKALDYYRVGNVDYSSKLATVRKIVFASGKELLEMTGEK
ncbi:MAG: hypothetical protein IK077_14895 [Thermoguttaceae bacterium]|nr:hypothetical protein [Thermoguttaceae bacterium]